MTGQIQLRPARPEDQPFLYSVYAGTRQQELAQTGWDEAQQDAFLRMQHELRTRAYRERFPGSDDQLILADGEPVGRLLVDRRPDGILIVDIAIVPEHRNRGIGGELLGTILAEATKAGKPVQIHVERFNPAQRFYARLGFLAVGQAGLYDLLEWRAGSSEAMPSSGEQ